MKLYTNFILMSLLTIVACSCEFETSDNGNLDGMWHLTAVDTLTNGTTEDVSVKRIYWSVQNHLLMFDDKSGVNTNMLLRFEHNGDSLRLYDPYIYDRDNGDHPLEDATLLLPFGMNALEQTYHIERLSGSHLTLSTNELRLYLKKI